MLKNKKYAKAYKEVLEIIKHFPKEEYDKIPKEEIEFYRENMDNDYEFSINPQIDLSKQNISREANAIIINLYQDYFATDEQKITIKEALIQNQQKEDDEKRKIYNPDDLFKKRANNDADEIEELPENMQMIEYKESFFTRFKNFIFSLLHLRK